MEVIGGTWTNISSDATFVRHLLDLYFCWEYPTLGSLSREHFLEDFERGNQRFCSSLLVNALLALGSRLSDRPASRADPNDACTSGDHFFKEAEKLLWTDKDHYKLTTIQALGLMSIREAGCGRDYESRYYAGQSTRLALEMGLHQVADSEQGADAVRCATYWGAFSLDHMWSLTSGSLPQCSATPRFPDTLTLVDSVELELWRPYTDDGTTLPYPAEQPCHIGAIYNCSCELSKIIHKSLYALYCSTTTINSKEVVRIYNEYLDWYKNVPEILRLGSNFTPQVLVVHMYYHYSILLTFRPFLKLRLSNSVILPRTLVSEAADAIHVLVGSYARLYTLRRTPSFVPYFLLQSSRAYLALEESNLTPGAEHATPAGSHRVSRERAEAFHTNINNLTEMAKWHPVAVKLLDMLHVLSRAWNVYAIVNSSLSAGQRASQFDLNWSALPGASGYTAFSFSPVERGAATGEGGSGSKEATMPSEDELMNALFWPSARPTWQPVPSGPHQLEEAGFEVYS